VTADSFDESLYPQVSVGSKVIVWCLEFPPERRGNEIWTRLLEEVEIEIVEIEQQDHQSDPKTKEFLQRIEAEQGRKIPQKPFRKVLGKDVSGREFHTFVAMQFAEKNRIEPGFLVPSSIKQGGGSPEWWTPELFRRNGWHLITDE
jgi:hypothetical protein